MSDPSGWVFQVARNHARRLHRRHALEVRLLRTLGNASASVGPSTDHDSTDLWRLVARLPGRQREAVVLRFILDLSEADIAKRMKITRGGVSSNLAKAQATLANLAETIVSSKD